MSLTVRDIEALHIYREKRGPTDPSATRFQSKAVTVKKTAKDVSRSADVRPAPLRQIHVSFTSKIHPITRYTLELRL